MKKILIKVLSILAFFGFNPVTLFKNVSGLRYYIKTLLKLLEQRRSFTRSDHVLFCPILGDRFSEAGNINGHYFIQDLYIAQRIYSANPLQHLDIGSRIDGFVAHIATFREIHIVDIRPQSNEIKNVIYRQLDIMNVENSNLEHYDSVSCLHALEHFGLGRYNDPIDYLGYEKAIVNISKILTPKGKFYLSVPIGKPRIEFNAHRVFSVKSLISILNKYFRLERFSYIDDKSTFYENVFLTSQDINSKFEFNFGCGIFEMTKE